MDGQKEQEADKTIKKLKTLHSEALPKLQAEY
jgi:hypothetical protein